MEQNATSPKRRSVVGPVILIVLGLVFLADNLNLLNWNAWEILWKLWPVWLIAVGLDIIIGRRVWWGSWVVLAVTLAIAGTSLFFGGWQAQATGDRLPGSAVSEPLNGAKQAVVELRPGVGRLRVGALRGSSASLIEGTATALNGERLVKSSTLSGDTARFTLRSEARAVIPFFNGRGNQGTWELGLNGSVPVELKLSAGVGEVDVDLLGLQVTNLQMESGVGRTYVRLPATGQMTASVKSGIGEVRIEVPEGMAFRVEAKNGIGSVDVIGEYDRVNGAYISRGYDSAPNRVNLVVEGGIGAVSVISVRP